MSGYICPKCKVVNESIRVTIAHDSWPNGDYHLKSRRITMSDCGHSYPDDFDEDKFSIGELPANL